MSKVKTFTLTDEEFRNTISRRARAIMELHGVKNAQKIPICTDALYERGVLKNKPNITDDELAAIAQQVAVDTDFYK